MIPGSRKGSNFSHFWHRIRACQRTTPHPGPLLERGGEGEDSAKFGGFHAARFRRAGILLTSVATISKHALSCCRFDKGSDKGFDKGFDRDAWENSSPAASGQRGRTLDTWMLRVLRVENLLSTYEWAITAHAGTSAFGVLVGLSEQTRSK